MLGKRLKLTLPCYLKVDNTSNLHRQLMLHPRRPAAAGNKKPISIRSSNLRLIQPVIIIGRMVTICGNAVISTNNSMSTKK